ncbi:MAG: NAD-dependent epimerase/dehydratase family protein [Gemmatimonas sp.]|jgi:ADP-L-glycero-D-manno-heptose 6-epimerase|uniref:NAD-dependent epimerase/dehydratase family protein n=1 Tax=Gemmatimonas sp. TaxID=1962908 RepID=UPI00391F3E89|nr:NAD-dependent epimerase/dehydratase family protein [Gemmatimonadota bacterium]
MHLVTGAAGVIGAHLAHQLHPEGAPLLLCDFAPDAVRARHLDGLEAHPFVDAANVFTAGAPLPSLGPHGSGVRAVWHLGANSSTTTRDWDHLLHVNVGASQQLWRWCAEHGVPFHYASSAATYGDGAMGFSDRTPAGQLVPLNRYGRSKNDFDAWVRQQVATGAPQPPHWAGFKFFNVYGAREGHKGRMASIIWKAERDMATLGRVQLFASNHPDFADGEQRRDFVYVGDVVDEMRWVHAHGAPGDSSSAGTGVASTFLEMIRAYCAARGEEPTIQFIPMPESLVGQDQNITQADMSTMRAAGWTQAPVLPPEGVARTLDEMRTLGCR